MITPTGSGGFSRRALLAAGSGVALAPLSGFGANSPSATKHAASHHPTGKTVDADIVVVGGGMAGVCAAIAAARNGATVALVQDRPVLGGNSSSEVRMHIVGADRSGGRKNEEARESGIIEELRLEEAAINPQRSSSMWDLVLYNAIRSEPKITLLLNTFCTGVRMADANRIAAVEACQLGSEKTFTIRGQVFIDCSGDGSMSAAAGAEFRIGRESRAEFGESIAPEKADAITMGSTILFTSRKYDRPMPFTPPAWIHRFPKCEDLPHRSHNKWEYGYWWIEWGGELNTITENDRIRDELLAAALGVWDHIKNSGLHPTSENWALEWLGFLPGKRESRRFVGPHMLIQQEVQRGETFDDGVAFGGWGIDIHPPGGLYSPEKPCDVTAVPLYNIPLRCLYSKNIANLMFAGRNVSVSRVAFGSTRVMATCAVMGQAVGTAAAMCVGARITPAKLSRDGIAELQQRLLRDDAYIIGAVNNDPADLARKATVRASSETPDSPAANVINGVARGVGHIVNGSSSTSNRWISDPTQPLPQWLELRFAQPARIREIHLTFDTGLYRPLTLSLQDANSARQIRGPQPETVRDYDLQIMDGESSTTVAEVTSNYQRKRIHRFDPKPATAIRLAIKATNGDKSARVFEVRAYEA